MTVAGLRGRPLRVLSELAGLLGAEITGTIAVALAGLVLAVTLPMAWIPWLALPVLLAGAGPVGFDMAQSWVPDDERVPSAPPGRRAAVYSAGVAGALVLAGALIGIAGAAPSPPTVTTAMVALLGLPYLAAVGRNLAVRTLSASKAVLPVALTVIVIAAPALFLAFAVLLGRFVGDD